MMDNQINPMDKYNKELLNSIHPSNYKSPEPKPLYDLVVIGAGTAGLVTAAASSGLGAKVALIEKKFMGGDCLNYGCVPSKALISSARKIYSIHSSNPLGIEVDSSRVHIDFNKIMERMRQKRSQISHHDSVKKFTEMGIDVFLGHGEFTDKPTIVVNDKQLKFKKAVITTGARPFIPPINGIEKSGYLTNETIFNLTKLPKKLIIIGGGPIGCELAQTFKRFGSDVFLIDNKGQLLNKEEQDAALIIHEQLLKEGVQIFLNSNIRQVEKLGNKKIATLTINNKEKRLEADEILIAAGRIPNIESLGLYKANVKVNKYGVIVNDKLQTTNPRIFSAGDVCSSYKFTHAADFMARIVIQNSLFRRGAKLSSLVIPWCTYTYPEIAHVGISENDAKEYNKFMLKFADVDRAVVSGEENGFVKILVKKGKDKIIGATIVAENAGDMISEITMAMVNKIGLSSIANIIHPYPTTAEAIRKLGDLYNRTKLTPFTQKVLKIFMRFGLQ